MGIVAKNTQKNGYETVITPLENMRIEENDIVKFALKSGVPLSGVVINAADPSLLGVKLKSGTELRIGRKTVLSAKKVRKLNQSKSIGQTIFFLGRRVERSSLFRRGFVHIREVIFDLFQGDL